MINKSNEFIKKELENFYRISSQNFMPEDTLRVDMHCHDYNSDTPDEIWGRILRLPETWLTTDELMKRMNRRVDTFVITNHNNARSCYDLLDRGIDTLVGAEFSVQFPTMHLMAHVLCYGFNPEQEAKLCSYRDDGLKFLLYAREQDLPVVLPHPLFLYNRTQKVSMKVYEQFALLFDNIEVVNGQRNSYQNYLVLEWIKSLDEEKILGYQKKYGINPNDFCSHPFRKKAFGGSDDHYGIFCGNSGTTFYIPELQYRLRKERMSSILLKAIRDCDTSPYGEFTNDEKLGVQFLNFFCTAALKMEDPGLIRMLLHQGSAKDKLACFALCNALSEIKRHKYTSKFLKVFQDAFQGKQPGLIKKLSTHPDYRSLFDDVADIAETAAKNLTYAHVKYNDALERMSHKMNLLVSDRVRKLRKENKLDFLDTLSPQKLIESIEVPANIREFVSTKKTDDAKVPSPGRLLDQLSFPMLATALLTGTRFAATAVINQNRKTVDDFAKYLGKGARQQRMLWLTDSLFDKNGVSSVLQAVLKEVRARDLPIDFLICDNNIMPASHLQIVPAVGSFSLPSLSDQEFHIPDLLMVQRIFEDGGYDRIMVSTEFCMGEVALYLKKAFNVPAYLLMHTDWLDYMKRTVKTDSHMQDRCRRLLRALYGNFNGIFALNQEHAEWLKGPAMKMSPHRVYTTAHWCSNIFNRVKNTRKHYTDAPVLLFAGRLSEEKGVMYLPYIFAKIRKEYPQAKLRIAGVGKCEAELKQGIPDAEFLGWVPQDDLPQIYSEADLLLLPSSFDTFGMVILEAMSCGLPVASFDCKGPRDLISDGENGILAKDAEEMANKIIFYLQKNQLYEFSQNALLDVKKYDATKIIDRLLLDCGIDLEK